MRIMLLGAPGAGKGTQAAFICKHFNIPQISTGDMLRAAVKNGASLGGEVKCLMADGKLIPDAIIMNLVEARLKEPDCLNGFLFDGFPRTLGQAEALKSRNIGLDYIIEFIVDDAEIIKRISGRRIHAASGRVYHILHNSPKNPCFDDLTGEPLVQRDDDKEDTVRERLNVYHQQTYPLIDYYKRGEVKYRKISGIGSVEEIRAKILHALDEN